MEKSDQKVTPTFFILLNWTTSQTHFRRFSFYLLYFSFFLFSALVAFHFSVPSKVLPLIRCSATPGTILSLSAFMYFPVRPASFGRNSRQRLLLSRHYIYIHVHTLRCKGSVRTVLLGLHYICDIRISTFVRVLSSYARNYVDNEKEMALSFVTLVWHLLM